MTATVTTDPVYLIEGKLRSAQGQLRRHLNDIKTVCRPSMKCTNYIRLKCHYIDATKIEIAALEGELREQSAPDQLTVAEASTITPSAFRRHISDVVTANLRRGTDRELVAR